MVEVLCFTVLCASGYCDVVKYLTDEHQLGFILPFTMHERLIGQLDTAQSWYLVKNQMIQLECAKGVNSTPLHESVYCKGRLKVVKFPLEKKGCNSTRMWMMVQYFIFLGLDYDTQGLYVDTVCIL